MMVLMVIAARDLARSVAHLSAAIVPAGPPTGTMAATTDR